MGKKAKAMTKEEKKENAKNQRKLHYAKNARPQRWLQRIIAHQQLLQQTRGHL